MPNGDKTMTTKTNKKRVKYSDLFVIVKQLGPEKFVAQWSKLLLNKLTPVPNPTIFESLLAVKIFYTAAIKYKTYNRLDLNPRHVILLTKEAAHA